MFAQGSPYYFFGTSWGGCAIGAGRRGNDLLYLYEKQSRFRAYVKNRIAAGTLVETNLVSLIADTSLGEADKRRDEREELIEEFFATRQ